MKDYHGLDIGYGTADSVEDLKKRIDQLRADGDRDEYMDTFLFWDDLGVWADSHYDSESAQVWRVWLWDHFVETEFVDTEAAAANADDDRFIDDEIENILSDYEVTEFDY